MFMRIDKLLTDLPEAKKPDPNAEPHCSLEVVDGYPEGGKIPNLDGNYGALAPHYALEEIVEIATKLYKKSRLQPSCSMGRLR